MRQRLVFSYAERKALSETHRAPVVVRRVSANVDECPFAVLRERLEIWMTDERQRTFEVRGITRYPDPGGNFTNWSMELWPA